MYDIRSAWAAMLCILFTACAAPSLFPDKAMKNVTPTFDFAAWREAASTNTGHNIQVGGRIVQASPNNGGLIIVAEQLPIVNHPAYGPTDTVKRTGIFEFAFLYPGELDRSWLTPGNRFIVVGVTQGTKSVLVGGAPKTEAYLVARCVHIWKTEGREIADFASGGVGGGFYPLEHRTHCAPEKTAATH